MADTGIGRLAGQRARHSSCHGREHHHQAPAAPRSQKMCVLHPLEVDYGIGRHDRQHSGIGYPVNPGAGEALVKAWPNRPLAQAARRSRGNRLDRAILPDT